MSQPWMPFYIGDYLRDTGRLTTEGHGAYLLLIMDYWANGSPPDDDETLASIAKLSLEAWMKLRQRIAPFFEIENGTWIHPRIEDELRIAAEKHEKRVNAGKAGSNARANAKQCSSNDPELLYQPQPQPQPQPLSNSELSSLRSDSAEKPKPAKRDPRGERLPDDWMPVDPGRAVEFLGDRTDAELDKFRDYWRAKPGKDGRKLDWEATWRNWLRTAAERANSRAPPSHGGGFAKIHAQFTGKPYE